MVYDFVFNDEDYVDVPFMEIGEMFKSPMIEYGHLDKEVKVCISDEALAFVSTLDDEERELLTDPKLLVISSEAGAETVYGGDYDEQIESVIRHEDKSFALQEFADNYDDYVVGAICADDSVVLEETRLVRKLVKYKNKTSKIIQSYSNCSSTYGKIIDLIGDEDFVGFGCVNERHTMSVLGRVWYDTATVDESDRFKNGSVMDYHLYVREGETIVSDAAVGDRFGMKQAGTLERKYEEMVSKGHTVICKVSAFGYLARKGVKVTGVFKPLKHNEEVFIRMEPGLGTLWFGCSVKEANHERMRNIFLKKNRVARRKLVTSKHREFDAIKRVFERANGYPLGNRCVPISKQIQNSVPKRRNYVSYEELCMDKNFLSKYLKVMDEVEPTIMSDMQAAMDLIPWDNGVAFLASLLKGNTAEFDDEFGWIICC